MLVPSLPLPVYWSWSEGEELPDGVSVTRGDLPRAMKLRVGLVQINPPKVTVEKNNVARIHVDVRTLVEWFLRTTGMSECEAEAKCGDLIRFVKTACNRVDVEITSDLSAETVTFTLPAEWRVVGILKNNLPIPYVVSDTNTFTFMFTHESSTLITIQLASDIMQLIMVPVGSIVGILAIIIIVSMAKTLTRMMKKSV
jgi:hypothetical protein